MPRFPFKTSWWPQKDLETFRLVKFFSLTSFVAILVFTVILTLLLSHRAQRLALEKSEDYIRLLAANLNHQVFQQFLIPVAIIHKGKITIADPEQFKRLDEVVRNTIHGFQVEQLSIYDQLGVLSYSSGSLPLGQDRFEVPGVKKALAGEPHFELSGWSPVWLPLAPLARWGAKEQRLTAYIPFRLENVPKPELGVVIGVFEISQNMSKDLEEIGRFQILTLATLAVIMGLLFVVLRQIVKQAEGILERRAAEQMALETQLHQTERLAALGEMTAGVAHEIRNPLGIISSTAELLKERLARYEPQNRLAQIIVEEANRLNMKVTEFLDFSRPRVPNLRPCNLEGVLDRSLEFLAPEIDRRGISVVRHYHLDGREQAADLDLLHQAFLNLLLNAIQAMPESGEITITTRPLAQGKGEEIILQDSGDGIDPQALKKVFNPFFTTKEKGSGLGLPIVKSIIESHQGAIKIDSTLGEGTTVTLTLPELPAGNSGRGGQGP